ncbi:MAG: alanine racemase [Magnetococcales bacterium]|nr:alanine racemase [Magnetococcales bacterium]
MTQELSRSTWLEVDLSAVQHNFEQARRAVGPGVGVFPVIKANGYGLGAVPIAHRLAAAGADGFCVARLEEAATLRHAGIQHPLVLLSGLSQGAEEGVVALNLRPFVFDPGLLPSLSRAAGRSTVALFLKVNTGMSRLGMATTAVAAAVAQARTLPGLHLLGLVSHMACADQPDHPENDRQRHCLQTVLTQNGLTGSQVSLANSAALLSHPDNHFSWVRPGIMLYGASPFFPARSGQQIGLRPVVRWSARILQVDALPCGAAVGYGQAFVTQRPSRIAILPVGYADGYNRLLGNRGRVLLAGHSRPVVGRVSMDMIAIDVTEAESVAVGDRVTLLGSDGEASIDVEEMAAWRGTIPYEVLCNLGERVPRFYV